MLVVGGFVDIPTGGFSTVEIFGCPDDQSKGRGILMQDFPVRIFLTLHFQPFLRTEPSFSQVNTWLGSGALVVDPSDSFSHSAIICGGFQCEEGQTTACPLSDR